MSSFDPYHLQPLATLNQRKIIFLPGIDPELIGKTGYEVASQPALMALMGEHSLELGLEQAEEGGYPQWLNEILGSPKAQLRIAGDKVAVIHGNRLGYLLASILLASQGLTDPLDPWEAAYLRCWREQVTTVVLGGGLANGRLGQVLAGAISEVFDNCDLPSIRVEVANYPSFLPLFGAARSLPGISVGAAVVAPTVSVVADFGGTCAKRGLAFYDQYGSLQRLQILPSRRMADLNASGNLPALADGMVSILAETLYLLPEDQPLIPRVLVCLAAYVKDGNPLNLERGGYYALNKLSSSISAWFSERLSQTSGREVQVEFLHDCDAAAVALAGKERSAVLMLGSALGVGFVPPEERYRRISSTFTLMNLGQEGDLQSSYPKSGTPEKRF